MAGRTRTDYARKGGATYGAIADRPHMAPQATRATTAVTVNGVIREFNESSIGSSEAGAFAEAL